MVSPIKRLGHSIQGRFNNARCNCLDFRTKRHIVVIESDDWGSIRMPSKEAWDELLKLGYSVDKRPYERFDTLESESDLEALFEVLQEFRDGNGNAPIITANMVMSNPDFYRIKESGYTKYYHRSLSETYSDYYGNDGALLKMREGFYSNLFYPQCHGMEHFNLPLWLHDLRENNAEAIETFKYGVCGLATKANPQLGNKYMIAYRTYTEQDLSYVLQRVKKGLEQFNDLWGFKSSSFVAPCYTWNDSIEKVLYEGGVSMIQTSRRQKISNRDGIRFHYSGEVGDNGILYSVRNCFFEPSLNDDYCLESTIQQIAEAFHHHKIAVVSSHRINYVGGLSIIRRNQSLNLLRMLLKTITSKWGDVEFISSAALCDYLSNQLKRHD